MKFDCSSSSVPQMYVAPCAGAGIEIIMPTLHHILPDVAPCAGAGIEICDSTLHTSAISGRPLCGGGD